MTKQTQRVVAVERQRRGAALIHSLTRLLRNQVPLRTCFALPLCLLRHAEEAIGPQPVTMRALHLWPIAGRLEVPPYRPTNTSSRRYSEPVEWAQRIATLRTRMAHFRRHPRAPPALRNPP
jgi:hypothetical protein